MSDDPKDTIAKILGLAEIPANEDGTTDWPAFAQQMLDLNKPCEVVIHHGPGHQSRSRCEAKGPHTWHYANLYGEHMGIYEWEGGDVFAEYEGGTHPVPVKP